MPQSKSYNECYLMMLYILQSYKTSKFCGQRETLIAGANTVCHALRPFFEQMRATFLVNIIKNSR
jgi:hypothetical protein